MLMTECRGVEGGAEKRLLTFARKIDRSRFRLSVVSMSPRGALLARLEAQGVQTCALNIESGRDYRHGLPRLLRWMRKFRPDVVNGDIRHAAFLGAASGRILRVPAVLATRTYTTRMGNHAFLDKITPRWVHHNIAVSQSAARVLVQDNGAPADRVEVIENGVDTERFVPASRRPESPVIVSVGNQHPIKGHRVLIEAMPAILETIPAAHLRLVGRPSTDGALEARVRALGIETSVTFAGPSQDVVAELQAASAFCLPSLNEGMSNALLEAMSTGAPIVATKVGGNAELIRDGQDGRLVPASSPEALASALVHMLNAPDAAFRMGASARARAVEHFSEARMIARYEATYARVYAEQTRGASRSTVEPPEVLGHKR